ncbi:MAG: 3-methylcrotonyl-CoA carboxylase alpha subunit [Bermanella sp.]|jgi:3-methylcrotonyl-CoA carboxylase alpha subunit
MNTINHKKITRLLIANRGEIAVRIMQSAQKIGIHCIALYSDADKNAMHVKCADEAWYIGASPAKDSYLVVDKVLQVAQDAHADAIHPGYGFLSENADFAQAIQDAGIIWVGPPVGAIQAMGSKSESKALMEKAKVPLVPGYHGDNQDEAFLAEQVKKIGFPVLIKASAGGGGKGMRVVENEGEIIAAIKASKREGLNSFGDDKLLAEKYITRPRHVEIQVFMDQHGNGVYLFERDCSIQRRHQKVVEEAPAPQFSEQERQAMGEAALQAAKAINYEGAGTVEFLYDNGTFYFMEMNTRLQVEHPVTEMITGQDLVVWQLKVAEGETLPLSQAQLSIQGHAMEVRIYAEDPNNDFLPTTGKLEHVQLPELIQGRVRLDTGVQQGDDVSPYYDPMISKLIVWGEDRDQCLSTLKHALQQYQIAGVTTNLSFLRRVVNVEAFRQGEVSTRFIEEFNEQLITHHTIQPHHLVAAVCQHMLTRSSHGKGRTSSNDQTNPWHALSAMRLNQTAKETLSFKTTQNDVFHVDVISLVQPSDTQQFQVQFDGQSQIVTARLEGDTVQYELGGKWQSARVVGHGERLFVYDSQGESQLSFFKADFNQQAEQTGSLTAPMNGTIIQIDTQTGQSVSSGDILMVMEAMKMEHAIKAPADGTIKEICFNVGDLVSEGAMLIEMEEA